MPKRLSSLPLLAFTLITAMTGFAQGEPPKTPEKTPEPLPAVKGPAKLTTGDQVAELAIVFYGLPGGRDTLNQIRKTTLERGTSSVTNADGKVENTTYQRFIIRGEAVGGDKVRLDQDFPNARYSLIYEAGKTYGIYNNTVFTPNEDAIKRFENQVFHGLEALLRYKENESKIELASREKVLGVDYYIIDITDKQERKTRFYVSSKTFRVMMLTYEQKGVKYKRRFYDYNYAQSTLMPFRTVLWAGDRIIEETEIGTITFGQKVDEGLFGAGG